MRTSLPRWSDSSTSECESTSMFESELSSTYDTSLVKPIEVSNICCAVYDDGV